MYADWNYWALYHSVTFDGVNKLITVNDGVTNLSIKINVYSDWKEWIALQDYAKFLPAIRAIGGDPTTSGQRAGDIYFLINGWRLVVDLTKTRIDGSLFSDNFDTPLLDKTTLAPTFSNLVSSLVTTAAIPDLSSLSIPSAIQNAQAVWGALLADFIAANTFGKRVQDVPTVAQIADGVWDEIGTDHLLAGSTGLILSQTKADTTAISLTDMQIKSIVEILLKYEGNRTKIDKIAKTLTVYDNDMTTIIKVFDLKDSTGAPSITEVAERVPV